MPAITRLFFDRRTSPAPLWAKGMIVGLLLLALAAVCWMILAASTQNWLRIWGYREAFWQGWILTVELAAFSLALSTVIGVLAALARRSEFLPLRYASLLYIECVRGMPFLVLILLLFYGMPGVAKYGDRFVFGVGVLSLFAGAYIAEIVRAGLESVGASQRESARAIGLDKIQTAVYVVFPQAIRQIIPPLTGQFASIIKDSSLLSIIGLSEFTYAAQQVNSATYSTLESFLPLGIGYLILTVPISILSKRIERTLSYET